MSLLLRDELRVVIYRDRIQVVHIEGRLTFRGWQYQIVEKKNYLCTAAEGSFSEDAIKSVETALSDLKKPAACAKVILSNHFMSYAMVVLDKALNSEAEELAYAKHCFNQLYGAGAADWELRLNRDYAATQQLASAVDTLFLQNLRAVFARANVKLQSIQPYLMAAYNNCNSRLQHLDAWFVLYENGSLCIGLVIQGHWSSIRAFNVGQDWFEKLNEILDRESLLSEVDVSSDRIFLWAPEYIKVDIPKNTRWNIQKLKPEIRASFAPEYDEQFAMAMCG